MRRTVRPRFAISAAVHGASIFRFAATAPPPPSETPNAAPTASPAAAPAAAAASSATAGAPGAAASQVATATGPQGKKRPTVIKAINSHAALSKYWNHEDPKDIRAAHQKYAHLAPSGTNRLAGWGTVAIEAAPALSAMGFGVAGVVATAVSGLPSWPLTLQFAAAFTSVQRFLCRGSMCPSTGMRDMEGKVCIVTGASSGIGMIVAAKLLDRGATVIATHNSMTAEATRQAILNHTLPDVKTKLEGDKMQQLTVWPLRLEERSTIARFANSVKQQFPKGVDVLVNNAGNMMGEDYVNTNGVEKTIDVSFLGPYALTETLLPLLHQVDGRIIYLTSHQHRIVTARDAPEKIVSRTIAYRHSGDDDMRYHRSRQFSQAKFGNACHVESLARRGFKAMAVNPGRSNTQLRRLVFPKLGTRYYWPGILWLLKTPEEGAQGVLHACLLPDDDVVAGGYYFNCKLRPHGMSPFVGMAADAACDWAAAETKVPLTRISAIRRNQRSAGQVPRAASLKPPNMK